MTINGPAARRVQMVLGGLLHTPRCFVAAQRVGLSAEVIADPVLQDVIRLIARGPTAVAAALKGSDTSRAGDRARKLHASSTSLAPEHLVALAKDLVADASDEPEHLELHEIAAAEAARFQQAMHQFEANDGTVEAFKSLVRGFMRAPGVGIEGFEVLVRAAANLVARGIETEDYAVELLTALGGGFDPEIINQIIEDNLLTGVEDDRADVEIAPPLVPDDKPKQQQTGRPTPQTVIEAIVISFCEHGLAAWRA